MVLLQIIGFIALGIGVLVAAAIGLPYVIAQSTAHDQATCQCWDCANRRHRAVERAKKKGQDPGPASNDPRDYWTTEELRTGYHVVVKDIVYEVGSIQAMPDGKTMVYLRNILNNRQVQPIMISPKMRRTKIWRKGFRQELYR